MKTRSPIRRMAVTVVAASALTACQAAPTSGPPPSVLAGPPISGPQVSGPADTGSQVADPSTAMNDATGMGHSAHAGFLAQLKLTEAQIQQLKTVVKTAIARTKPFRDAINPLITAPEVDRTAVRSAFEVFMQADAMQDAQTLAEARTVLTEEQRTLLASKALEMGTTPDDPHMKLIDKMFDKVPTKVTMTAEQQAAFGQLRAAMRDFWMSNRAEYMTSMGTFMQNGDQEALRETFARLAKNVPVDAMVGFMASLDQSQRQALVAWKEDLLARIQAKL